MTPRRVLLITVALALCGGCGDQDQTAGRGRVLARYPVARGNLDITVTETASLKSAETVRIVIKVGGRISAVIPDGTVVKKGERLVELTNEELTRRLDQTRLDLEKAERGIAAAQSAVKLHLLDAAKKLDDARRKQHFATLALAEYRDGSAPLKERDYVLAAERAAIDAQDALEKHQRMPGLLEQGFVTAAEVRSAELDAREKAAKAAKAKAELANFHAYERPQELAKREADLRDGELEIERVTETNATEGTEKEAEVRVKTQERERLAGLVKELEEQVSWLVVDAPGDGIVLYGDERSRRWGNEVQMPVGTQVNQNQCLMSIPDLTNMVAEATVNELSINRIRLGMAAETRIDSLGRTFTGTVQKVATINLQDWRSDEKQYATEVSLGDTQGVSFRPGMSARVTFLVERLTGVLTVPVEAVYQKNGKSWCSVAGTTREVELGASSDERVVVVKGLAEGETVEVLAVEPGG